MQIIITDAWLAKSRALHLSGTRLGIALAGLFLGLMLVTLGLYHWVFLQGAREGWPVFSAVGNLLLKSEADQRDRYLRENLEAMARRVGELQAKVVQLEALGERVSGLAGVNLGEEIKAPPGRGGVLVPGPEVSMEQLNGLLAELEHQGTQDIDVMTVLESRLVEQKIRKSMIPTEAPVHDATVGSGFGWRIDPFTGRNALHTGLDFASPVGTPIYAAAGGVVVAQEYHPEYGNMVEIDHGNDLISRYAHASKVLVKKGDLIRRGQKIAEIGSTGRSTGPHLHFEVLVQGVPQDPQKFLSAGRDVLNQQVAHADMRQAGRSRAHR